SVPFKERDSGAKVSPAGPGFHSLETELRYFVADRCGRGGAGWFAAELRGAVEKESSGEDMLTYPWRRAGATCASRAGGRDAVLKGWDSKRQGRFVIAESLDLKAPSSSLRARRSRPLLARA